MGATGLEPVTPSVSSKGTSDASETDKGVTAGAPFRCTSGCTSEGQTANADPLAPLAAALLALSPADRARLAALLTAATPGAGNGSAGTPGPPADGTEGGKTT
jgi:hypothetical protein